MEGPVPRRRRLPTVAWAATVLALLVLPPALSTGQGTGTTTTEAPPAEPTPLTPADPQQGTGGSGGSGGAAQQPAEEPAPTATTSTDEPDLATASATKRQQAKAAGSLTVSIGDNFYSPRNVTIDVGDTITWRNNGAAQHSATADDGSFDTGVFGPGASRSHKFNSAGSFPYFCTVHGQAQSGTVTVSSGGGGGGGGGGGQSEAAAVASSGAAGSSSSLPSTGSDVLPPMAVGLLLLLAGLALRLRDWFGPA